MDATARAVGDGGRATRLAAAVTGPTVPPVTKPVTATPTAGIQDQHETGEQRAQVTDAHRLDSFFRECTATKDTFLGRSAGVSVGWLERDDGRLGFTGNAVHGAGPGVVSPRRPPSLLALTMRCPPSQATPTTVTAGRFCRKPGKICDLRQRCLRPKRAKLARSFDVCRRSSDRGNRAGACGPNYQRSLTTSGAAGPVCHDRGRWRRRHRAGTTWRSVCRRPVTSTTMPATGAQQHDRQQQPPSNAS